MLQVPRLGGVSGQGSGRCLEGVQAEGVGEGLRKLPHPQLWFLVGPPWQQGEGGVCHPSNKGSETKETQGTLRAGSKGAKNKARSHLSSDGHLRVQAWPGGWENRAQHTRTYTTACTGLRPAQSPGLLSSEGPTLDLMLGCLCLKLNF